jgi:dsDNA-binding SOS-regulon protein
MQSYLSQIKREIPKGFSKIPNYLDLYIFIKALEGQIRILRDMVDTIKDCINDSIVTVQEDFDEKQKLYLHDKADTLSDILDMLEELSNVSDNVLDEDTLIGLETYADNVREVYEGMYEFIHFP